MQEPMRQCDLPLNPGSSPPLTSQGASVNIIKSLRVSPSVKWDDNIIPTSKGCCKD